MRVALLVVAVAIHSASGLAVPDEAGSVDDIPETTTMIAYPWQSLFKDVQATTKEKAAAVSKNHAGQNFVAMKAGLESDLEAKVIRFYHVATERPKSDDITLSVQGDIKRLERLPALADKWEGPISAAILVEHSEKDRLRSFFDGISRDVAKRLDVHAVVTKEGSPRWTRYPINYMRNTALKDLRSNWVYVIDIDEDPVFKMERYRQSVDKAMETVGSAAKGNAVFVATSWQWARESKASKPTSKDEIVRLHSQGDITVKHPEFTKAYLHPKVDFDTWAGMGGAKLVDYVDAYEPYFITKAATIPHFDERFSGFGGNAAAQVLDMALRHFRFVVVPDVFNFADETPHEATVGHSAGQQDMDTMQKAWDELGRAHGCDQCRPHDCVRNCPWLLTPADSGGGGWRNDDSNGKLHLADNGNAKQKDGLWYHKAGLAAALQTGRPWWGGSPAARAVATR